MRTIKGFTLIEVVIVLVTLGIIAATSSVLLKNGFQSYFVGESVSELNTQAELVMARMTQELQQAVSFSAINATNVTFVTSGGNTISYSWATPTLTRTGATAQTLNDQVTAFALSYYQKSMATTATVGLVRAVTITMTLNSGGTENVSLVNTIYLPNMFG